MEYLHMDDEKYQRIIQEYVPGRQVTLAHIIASPDKILYKKLASELNGAKKFAGKHDEIKGMFSESKKHLLKIIPVCSVSEETWTKKVGADGEVTRSQSNDNTHTVQLTLQQSSASNDYLSTCMNADKLTGMGMLPLSITDLNGTTLHFWPQVWVQTDPSYGFAKEVTDRQWTLHTGQEAGGNYGGNLIG